LIGGGASAAYRELPRWTVAEKEAPRAVADGRAGEARAAEQRAVGAPSRWSEARRRVDRFFRDLYYLPPRIQRVVDTDAQQADLIGAWTIFVVASFVGLLYLFAPKPADSTAQGQPVLWVVGLFIASALVRLRLAYMGPLSRWLVGFFIVTDFALLYGLIWAFHLHYNQPPAFYLKAPTFLFVFLLIAVRALRFEPGSVLAAGLVAAVGWALLVVYAATQPSEPAVTRDFVRYMTGSLVLVGAEIEKIVAILLVTVILTAAIVRGRRALVTAAREEANRSRLARFFAPDTAQHILASSETSLKPGFGEIRQAAVLVADLRGFTSLAARRDPKEVIAVLIDYQRSMGEVIARHRGAIDKFLGDGILATFGCAHPSKTPAADGLRALVDMMVAADSFEERWSVELGEPMRVGFAFTTGPVLYGTIGDGSRLEYTVIGDPVNLAVKLEPSNKLIQTRALADHAALEQAGREGYVPSWYPDVTLPRLEIQGVASPHSIVGWRRR
jgi:adenylate cyclase